VSRHGVANWSPQGNDIPANQEDLANCEYKGGSAEGEGGLRNGIHWNAAGEDEAVVKSSMVLGHQGPLANSNQEGETIQKLS
jgi:hypothetical protein